MASAALNTERLLSARLRYSKAFKRNIPAGIGILQANSGPVKNFWLKSFLYFNFGIFPIGIPLTKAARKESKFEMCIFSIGIPLTKAGSK